MLKVACESCKALYNVEERRVPPSGLKMRCPKCGHTFIVTDPAKTAAVTRVAPTAAATENTPSSSKETLVAISSGDTTAAVVAKPRMSAPSLAEIAPAGLDEALALPAVAVKPAIPRVAARAPAPPPAKAPPSAKAPPPPPPSFTQVSSLPSGTATSDDDLPALASDAALPAVVSKAKGAGPRAIQPPRAAPRASLAPAAPATPATAKAQAASSAATFSFDFDSSLDLPAKPQGASGFGTIDLPAPKQVTAAWNDLPAPQTAPEGAGARSFGTVDLPSAKVGMFDDLPLTMGDLPAVSGHGNLPAVSGHGNLPAVSGHGNLPAVSGHGNLPAVSGHGNLPAVSGHGNLPAVSGHANLPAVSGHGNLPAVSGFATMPSIESNQDALPVVGGSVPMFGPAGSAVERMRSRETSFGDIDLPSDDDAFAQPPPAPGRAPAPAASGGHANILGAAGSEASFGARLSGGPPALSFGELDLPSADDESAHEAAPHVNFGDLDFSQDPPPVDDTFQSHAGSVDAYGRGEASLPPRAAQSDYDDDHAAARGGGLGFGEVDLGGDSEGGEAILGPPPAASGASMFEEASLDTAGAGQGPGAARAGASFAAGPQPAAIKRSKTVKLAAILVATGVVGGAALALTPVGAFGTTFVSDKLHAGSYRTDALKYADSARAKLALDTFAMARQAADELAELHRNSPRNRPLAAYAAYIEFANQVRFGTDAARLARAKTFLSDIPPESTEPYVKAAFAAQLAASGSGSSELKNAQIALTAAIAKEPKDGIQLDLAVLRGSLAWLERDTNGAVQAFGEALKRAPSARAHFGLAKVFYATKALKKAKEETTATLAASPDHAGARTLGARLAMDLDRNAEAALKDIALVLDDKARARESANEVSTAFAARGWIMLALDRAGDARAAFDEAVKLDPRNVTALVGQGEVLYADGRYTEALTRFDEAVAKDPTGTAAVVGAAKTKIALERLADAKTQLAQARARAPKEMLIVLWLAKAEEALGNKAVAEKLYGETIDLADVQNPDAILAYASYASFLASQGKPGEAQAKLDQARSKLPDSAALQRAVGDVAAAQGHFDEALSHFEAALEKSPNDLGTRFRLGVTYRRMSRIEQAAKQFDQIVAIDREYPGIALERGLLFEHSGDVQKALEQFQSAAAKAPKDIDLMLRVGAAYVSIGEVDKALPLLTKVREERPNSAEASHFVGRAYLKRGGLEAAQAMRYLQRAVELDPNKADYHLYVAWAANDAIPAQLGLARTHAERALAIDNLLADGYWQRGLVSLREGALNDALKDLRHALELKPARHEAYAALAEVFEQKNDVAAAMAAWAKAIAGDDKVAVWRFKYGLLLLEKGQAAEAAKHLAFAVDASKNTQPRPGWLGRAAFEAGEAQRKTNQKAAAIDSYNYFLDLATTNDPNRREALRALRGLGAPHDG